MVRRSGPTTPASEGSAGRLQENPWTHPLDDLLVVLPRYGPIARLFEKLAQLEVVVGTDSLYVVAKKLFQNVSRG